MKPQVHAVSKKQNTQITDPGRVIMQNTIQTYVNIRNVCYAMFLMLFLALITGQTAFSQAANGDVRVTDEHTSPSVHPGDSLALVAFYHSMNGETWRDQGGWLVEMVDNWNGIRIDEIEVEEGVYQWRVTRINLFDNAHNMTECGYLAPELAELTYLERLSSAREMLCGDLPEEIFGLEFFHHVRVRANYLTGFIPWDAIGNSIVDRLSIEQNNWTGPVMTAAVVNNQHLEEIVLDEADMLTGSFPPELGQLQNLTRFGADALTRIEGPIPDLSNLENIETIEIAYSNFDPGEFPEWIRDLGGDAGISRLAIQQTNITGELPQWLPELSRVSELKVGGTEMGMDMADFPDLSNMGALRRFRIWGGNFHGELPDWFRHLDVDRLWIGYTNIGGDLPSYIGELQSLSLLKIRHNQFTGGMPQTFSLLTNLSDLALEYNNMEIGDIPEFIGNNLTGLNKLFLAGSGVTGEIPANLNQIDGLTHIRLQDNPGLGGTLPGWIWEKDLHALDISHTNIDLGGEFPSELQHQSSIYKLGLAGLGLEGSIPDWLGELDFYRTDGTRDQYPYISLADNNLTGEIPASFANLRALDSLNLANNDLEGSIEMLQYVGRVTGSVDDDPMLLSALDVSGNPRLTGEIPSSFIGGSRLRVFRFADTDLCMPAGLQEYLEDHEERATTSYTNRTPAYSDVTYSDVGNCGPVSAELVNETVNRYFLHQNYPNPFNPTSMIRFEIAEAVNVNLTIYNVLGQKVATLVNEPRTAGVHEVQFDASGLASGQYIYRLEAGDRVMTQTMTLIK